MRVFALSTRFVTAMAFASNFQKLHGVTAAQHFFADFMGIRLRFARRGQRHILDKLDSRSPLDMKETQKTLKLLGFSWNEVVSNMELFALPPSCVKQRHASLLEIGLKDIKAPEILRYMRIVKQSKRALVTAGVLAPESDPIGLLLERLNVPSTGLALFTDISIDSERTFLQTARECVFAHIVNRKLGFEHQFGRNMFKECPRLHDTCLAYVDDAIDILTNELGLKQQLRRHPIVLSVPPEDLRRLFDIARKYDLNMRQMVFEMPRVLCINPLHVQQSCRHLTEYGVPANVVTCSPAIFYIDPDSVHDGLRALSRWPGFEAVKCDPAFHLLLAAHREAVTRLIYMEHELGSSREDNCNLEYLMTSDELFRKFMIMSARDAVDDRATRAGRHRHEDLAAFIADMLGCAYGDVLQAILAAHGNLKSSATVASIGATIAFLLDERRFTKLQILKGLLLVFHPRDAVERVLDELPESAELIVHPYEEWRRDPNFLQLVLYFVEKASPLKDSPSLDVQDDL